MSSLSKNLVVSGDRSGNIVVWHTALGEIRSHSPLQSAITCLQFCPVLSHGADVISVGYQNGSLLILDTGTGRCIKKHAKHFTYSQP